MIKLDVHFHSFSSRCLRSRSLGYNRSLRQWSTSQHLKSMTTETLANLNSDSQKRDHVESLKERLKMSWAHGLKSYYPSPNNAFSPSSTQNQVPSEEVHAVLDLALPLLAAEKNVIPMHNKAPNHLTIVGDTHGQFYDLLNMLSNNGEPDVSNKYVFNGDFVDRGSFSFQTVFLLLVYKVLFPESVVLLRGNHETVFMNKMYGFLHEILAKYDSDILNKFWAIFDALPFGCVITNETPSLGKKKVMVLHGGLVSDRDITIEQMQTIPRNKFTRYEERTVMHKSDVDMSEKETELLALYHDILWSDPKRQNGLSENHARNGGLLFGPDITAHFLKNNGLDLIVRSHQVRKHGYTLEHNGQLITLFSAPNYCDSVRNKGAILRLGDFEDDWKLIWQFKAVEHPPIPPMVHKEIATARL